RSISTSFIQSAHNRPPKAVRTLPLHRHQCRHPFPCFLQYLPRPIGAAVIHHHNFVRHTPQPQFHVKMLHRRADAAFLIPRRDHHGKQSQGRCAGRVLRLQLQFSVVSLALHAPRPVLLFPSALAARHSFTLSRRSSFTFELSFRKVPSASLQVWDVL